MTERGDPTRLPARLAWPAAARSSPAAARGIGAAIARRFAAEGAQVAVIDLLERPDGGRGRGHRWRTRSSATSPTPTPHAAATEQAIDALGGIDVLVNNAGILRFAPLLDITVEDWDLTFDVNVRAMLLTTQVAATRDDRRRAAVARSSTWRAWAARSARPNQAHYAASKAAVISLTRVSAMELGRARHHGQLHLPRLRAHRDGRGDAHARDGRRSGRRSRRSAGSREPDDVANMALFLASDEASYCTGQAMNVTGGMVMH